jgi:hypothetical protein
MGDHYSGARPYFNSRHCTRLVHYRIMALHNMHLVTSSSNHNITPRSKHHRSISIKPRGYQIIRFTLKRTRRNQRYSVYRSTTIREKLRVKRFVVATSINNETIRKSNTNISQSEKMPTAHISPEESDRLKPIMKIVPMLNYTKFATCPRAGHK